MENTSVSDSNSPDRLLFLTCFIAIVTTAFGFILRAIVLPDWGVDFNLTQTQLGEISGVGLWPFAISIVVFSLVVDKIGYKTSLGFAFICHVTSVILTVTANGYSTLYLATFIGALGNGVVEAVANPVVATMFSKDKTKWLNMLHAGWPGGLVLGGIIALLMGADVKWEYKIALTLIPTIVYGVMMLRRKFPLNERVQAGVSYKEMLQEVGAAGALIIISIVVFQLGEVFAWSVWLNVAIIMLITLFFGFYTKSFGQPLFVILLVIMIPLAITELGTDSWITDLMTPAMSQIGLQAGWVLVYTSAIMFVLRLFAGPIIHKVSPLGLLAICSLVAAVGLFFLSRSVGVMILVAATIYGFGKAFFWPTMLGVVAERFPKGGALTLNIIGGLGMIAAGVIGAGIIGFIQDSSIEKGIREYDMVQNTELSQKYITDEKTSVFGDYRALDQQKLSNASETEIDTIREVQHQSKKEALQYIVIFPLLMFVSYLALIFYFKKKGGYAAVALTSHE
ncbi:MFS transporter [Flavobacteriaceae bacterium XHP0103]|uniref:MFS transporter n=1 Tax=Marixanthotalea marina TaxID=2844359 RepID=UPI002989C3C8|nr:MFS transporter [Marixanthotalea marina]MBU3820964.1 MFS transporter [Marixanthotalea marina]